MVRAKVSWTSSYDRHAAINQFTLYSVQSSHWQAIFPLVRDCISCTLHSITSWHIIATNRFYPFQLFLMSMTGFSGSDDVLACFAAGNAFSWDDWFRQETEEAHFQEVIDMMLNLAVFAYIGAIIVSIALLSLGCCNGWSWLLAC